MNNSLRHLHPTPPLKIVFAIVLTLLSLYLVLGGALSGFILLGIALKLALREGIEVDLNGKRYRKIYSIFDLSMGAWKRLPAIEYISVFKTKKKSRTRGISAEASLDFIVYKLNLFYSRNKHIEAYVSDDKVDAMSVAQHIATVLNLEIYDATNE
jgi:hypothetical protein